MHLSFPQQLEAFINHQVETGLYNNRSDVVFDAVRRMYEEKLGRLKHELAIAEEQLERGEFVEYESVAALMDNAMKQARENSRKGKKVNPCVTPNG